ncbi:replication initiation protein [Chitinasiproducens palmae]|uniref:Initiator Replication protein n=1 Tax=Chitinasiproducens palmae TaxID=1770053 RepID=A0A1H2PIG8_9BURK|nr:replication initiation protein [Chitinasiproducens palmae]SDV46085.1 Initiator Replication protein [Chitinasiproducens palmae]
MANAPRTVKEAQIALFQTPEPPEPFKKAVQAVHIAPKSGAITLQQAKMFNALIKNAIAQHGDDQRLTFEYSVRDLIEDVGLNSNNRNYVKATINSLVGTVVNWDHLMHDSRSVWKASGLLSGAEIDGSRLRYNFSDQIRELLLNPVMYAMIDMRITRQFKRGHSLTLWENVVRYEGVGRTGRIPIKTFRELFLGQDSAKSSYREYKIFKSRILIPAMREVNEVTDHTVELIEYKHGRSVAEVQFTITRKPSAKSGDEVDAEMLRAVTRLGVLPSEARKLIAEYGDERIRQAIEYTNERLGKKNAPAIDNVAAYFRRTLSEGWKSNLSGAGSPLPSKDSPSATNGLSPEDLKNRYLASQVPLAKDYLKELAVEDQSALVEEYNAQVSVKQLRMSLSRKPSAMAERSFLGWVAERTWGEPSDRDLLQFLLTGMANGAAADDIAE